VGKSSCVVARLHRGSDFVGLVFGAGRGKNERPYSGGGRGPRGHEDCTMSSTLGGDDPLYYDLSPQEKDREEKRLRAEGRKLRLGGKHKEGKRKDARANEISRRKSKKAHQ
jgi:hypothetical protein